MIIIRTQNRDKIIKCEYIKVIHSSECFELRNNGTCLWIYKTKERCIEILDDIECRMITIESKRRFYHSHINVNDVYARDYVFDMPKD